MDENLKDTPAVEPTLEQQVKDAEAAARRADDAHAGLVRMVEQEKWEARQRAEREVRDRHADALQAASAAKWAAQRLLESLRVQIAQAGKAAPVPLGTEVFRVLWTYGRFGRFPRPELERGVVEVVTNDTVHPENVRDRYRAKVGEVVVRNLLASGKPGKSYHRLGSTQVLAEWQAEPPSSTPWSVVTHWRAGNPPSEADLKAMAAARREELMA